MDDPTIPQKNDRRKQWIFIAVVMVALLAAVSYLLQSGRIKKFPGEKPAPAAPSREAEHARVLEEIALPSVFGNITKIEGGAITVDVPEMLGVAVPANSPRRVKTVMMSPETKIFDRFSKSDEILRKEIEVYKKKANQNVPPPPAYELKEISIDDLKVGDGIMIEGELGLDLKDLASVPALKITRVNLF